MWSGYCLPCRPQRPPLRPLEPASLRHRRASGGSAVRLLFLSCGRWDRGPAVGCRRRVFVFFLLLTLGHGSHLLCPLTCPGEQQGSVQKLGHTVPCPVRSRPAPSTVPTRGGGGAGKTEAGAPLSSPCQLSVPCHLGSWAFPPQDTDEAAAFPPWECWWPWASVTLQWDLPRLWCGNRLSLRVPEAWRPLLLWTEHVHASPGSHPTAPALPPALLIKGTPGVHTWTV